MPHAQTILDQLDLVKLDIHLWTSAKKLRPEDLKLGDGSKLPPDKLASLGTKKTIDPKALNEFARIKKEAGRICLQTGTRFLGGFANPRTEIPRITAELDLLAADFERAKHDFLATYEDATMAWVNQHPEFASAIRRAVEPVDSVAAKLAFDYVIFRIGQPEPEQQASLERKALGLSGQLFKEIAQEAKELVDGSFVGKDSVSGRALGTFRRIRAKLDSLGFLDACCHPIVDKIDRVLGALPKSGPYGGAPYHELFTLALLLSDPDKLRLHGQGLLLPYDHGNQADDISLAGIFDLDPDPDTALADVAGPSGSAEQAAANFIEQLRLNLDTVTNPEAEAMTALKATGDQATGSIATVPEPETLPMADPEGNSFWF